MSSTLWIDLVLRQNFICVIWWRGRFCWPSEKDSVYLAVPETESRLTFLRSGFCFAITALSVWPDISRACWVHHTPGRHLCKLIQHRRPLSTSSIFNLTENFKNWPRSLRTDLKTAPVIITHTNEWKTNWAGYVILLWHVYILQHDWRSSIPLAEM